MSRLREVGNHYHFLDYKDNEAFLFQFLGSGKISKNWGLDGESLLLLRLSFAMINALKASAHSWSKKHFDSHSWFSVSFNHLLNAEII